MYNVINTYTLVKRMWTELKLENIRIKNFKGIEEVEIKFDKKFNVIIGNNGVGKTSILDAISVSLGGFISGVGNVYGKHFQRSDVRKEGSIMGDASFNIQHKFPVEVECSVLLNNKHYLWTRRKKSLFASRSTVEPREIARVSKELVQADTSILPIINYQGALRTWGKGKTDNNLFKGDKLSRTSGYIDSLNPGSDNRLLLSWCSRMEQISWQEDKKIEEYESVKKAVSMFMSKMTETNMRYTKVIYDKKSEELMYRYNGLDLPISQLSSGYQALIWLVFDIAYRMSVLNPNLRDSTINETPGIVLIDEIDVHLHPTWQWKVIDALQTTFPKVQFIATTHSPIVLASCKDVNVINIDLTEEIKIKYENTSYGLSIDKVLNTQQNSNNIANAVQMKLDNFSEFLDKNDYSGAREILEELKNSLGMENPSVVEAMMELSLEEMDIEW